MGQVAAVNKSIDANVFQRYLIPSESKWVGRAMQQAAHYGRTGDFVYSRIFSVALVVGAVAMSIINGFSYLLQLPFKILVNVARLDPLRLVMDIGLDITNVVRSYVFSCLGVTLMVLGFFFPKQVYSHFEPEYVGTSYDKLADMNERMQKDIKELKGEVEKLGEKLKVVREERDSARADLEEEKAKKSFWSWIRSFF